ncbi:aquaporin [Streptomyces olivaceoviridis]|uniref:aquaporin n=1 Tax=Streptomyces olivaceoviridis TaxID=1921 RepID=UPI0036F69494
MFALVTIAGVFIRRRRLNRCIPWLVGTMISAQAIAFATPSGGSVSPARQFGPAVMAGDGALFWVYMLVPMLGAWAATTFGNGVTTAHTRHPRP